MYKEIPSSFNSTTHHLINAVLLIVNHCLAGKDTKKYTLRYFVNYQMDNTKQIYIKIKCLREYCRQGIRDRNPCTIRHTHDYVHRQAPARQGKIVSHPYAIENQILITLSLEFYLKL